MSSQEKKYVYLEMPISFEEKREWNKRGFKVADKEFMPEGYENPAPEPVKPLAPVKQKPKG